jgi:hypothetical protein
MWLHATTVDHICSHILCLSLCRRPSRHDDFKDSSMAIPDWAHPLYLYYRMASYHPLSNLCLCGTLPHALVVLQHLCTCHGTGLWNLVTDIATVSS